MPKCLRNKVSLVAVLWAFVPATTWAELPAPGSTYHVLFASSELFKTTNIPIIPPPVLRFGSIAAADYVVTDAAWNAQLPGTPSWDGISPIYHSILSISGNNAQDRLTVAGPVFNTHGTRLADSEADLFDVSLYAAVEYDEFAQAIVDNVDVWTGTISTGIWAGSSCGTWNSTSSGVTGRVGSVSEASSLWVNTAVNKPCNQSARLYGLSPALTAPLWGDYNDDGTVDGADYVMWRKQLGSLPTAQFQAARAFTSSETNVVSMADYDVWRNYYGQSLSGLASGASLHSEVPEPATWILAAIAVGEFLRNSHRRKRRAARN